MLKQKQNFRIFKWFLLNWYFYILLKLLIHLDHIDSIGDKSVFLWIMSAYGGTPNKQQTITWINDDPVHWRIYASPGLNK